MKHSSGLFYFCKWDVYLGFSVHLLTPFLRFSFIENTSVDSDGSQIRDVMDDIGASIIGDRMIPDLLRLMNECLVDR